MRKRAGLATPWPQLEGPKHWPESRSKRILKRKPGVYAPHSRRAGRFAVNQNEQSTRGVICLLLTSHKMQRSIPKTNPAGKPLIRPVCLLLALITLVLYLPVKNFQFNNYDDAQYLTQNPAVQNGITVQAITWAFT